MLYFEDDDYKVYKYYLEELTPWSCVRRYVVMNVKPCYMSSERAVCDTCKFRKYKEFYYIGVMR